MAVLHGTVRDNYQAITRRIVIQVIKRLRSHLSFNKDTVFIIKGLEDNLMVWNSEKNELQTIRHNPGEDSARFGEYDQLEIEFKEELTDDGIARNGYMTDMLPSIFHDERLGIRMNVGYIQTRVTLSFTFKSGTWESMQTYEGSFARLLQSSRTLVLHELEYYVLPELQQCELLRTLYDLKEKRGGIGDTFDEWMDKNTKTGAYRTLTNRKGNGAVMAFKERQRQIILMLMETQLTDAQKKERGASAETQFEVQFYYDAPYYTTIEYPLMVHNQVVPGKWFVGPRVHHANRDHEVTFDKLQDGLQHVISEDQAVSTFTSQEGLRYPSWDSWKVSASHYNNMKAATILIQLPEKLPEADKLTNYTLLLPCSAIESNVMKFGHGTKRYMKDNRKLMFSTTHSPVVYQLYQGNERVDMENCYLDEKLDLYTNYKLEYWQQWHLVIEIPNNYNHIERDTMNMMMRYPDFLAEIYQTLLYKERNFRLGATIEEVCKEYLTRIPMLQSGMWYQIYRCLMLNKPLTMQYGEHIEKYFYTWLMAKHPEYKDLDEAKDDWYHFDLPHERHAILLDFQPDLFEWLKAHHDDPDAVNDIFYGKADVTKVIPFLTQYTTSINNYFMDIPIPRTQMMSFVNAKRLGD